MQQLKVTNCIHETMSMNLQKITLKERTMHSHKLLDTVQL